MVNAWHGNTFVITGCLGKGFTGYVVQRFHGVYTDTLDKPAGTKPLSEPMLSYHQWGSLVPWGNFQGIA